MGKHIMDLYITKTDTIETGKLRLKTIDTWH